MIKMHEKSARIATARVKLACKEQQPCSREGIARCVLHVSPAVHCRWRSAELVRIEWQDTELIQEISVVHLKHSNALSPG